MKHVLTILHLEDDPADAELVEATLAAGGVECEILVVSTRDDFVAALDRGGYDLVLADFALPGFDGMGALAIVREGFSDIPFVFVSGRLGEEAAIESLKSGATDYVLKGRLSRLVPAVQRALDEAAERAELRRAEEELARANREIREQAESYRNLFNSIRDVILVTGEDRVIVQVNQPALRETFGYEFEEVAGRKVALLYADPEEYRRMGDVYELTEPGKGTIREVTFRRKNGETFMGELYALKRLDSSGAPTGNIGMVRDISERRLAERALRESEMKRMQLEMELVYAAQVQAKLLPLDQPSIQGFDVAARCVPAKQVGGDFFDWQEISPHIWSITLGDVMGKGMAAAMLMATVRAALRSVVQRNRPAAALRLAERAILPDLENAESFVTLFHAQLDADSRSLTYVDCGHGHVFLRRASGEVEGLSPRGLPLGVPGQKMYEEGTVSFDAGDILVIYSDGLVDARPELGLTGTILAAHLPEAGNAAEIVDRLVQLTEREGPLPDDVTVLVALCTG